jgi:hypothetical protein
MKKLLMAGAVCAALGFAAPASAVFYLEGGTPYNDPNNAFGAWFGGTSSNVSVLEQGTLKFTGGNAIFVEFLGKEAGFASNQFYVGAPGSGTLIADTGPGTPGLVPDPVPPSPPGWGGGLGLVPGGTVYTTGELAAGTVLFHFLLNAYAPPHVVENGHDDTHGNDPGFTDDIAFWFGPAPTGGALPSSGHSVYILLDDGGGNFDNDHDDMVIRLTEVPEPSTWALMLSGLGLLGLIAKRRMTV